MYRKPLDFGQAFSFANKVYAVLNYRLDVADYHLVDKPTYKQANRDGRVAINPGQRFIVYDEPYGSVDGTWLVRAWLPQVGKVLVFAQLIGRHEYTRVIDPRFWSYGFEQSGAVSVTNVGWPDPSPLSLMVQVRALSCWSNGSAITGERTPQRAIDWQECQKLARMPLAQGLPLAVKWLSRVVDDPVAALRQRGLELLT